jgi:hypothetical protein
VREIGWSDEPIAPPVALVFSPLDPKPFHLGTEGPTLVPACQGTMSIPYTAYGRRGWAALLSNRDSVMGHGRREEGVAEYSEQGRAILLEVEDAYAAFLAGTERYQELLQEVRQRALLREGSAPFLAWLDGQIERVERLEALMEGAVLEEWLRVLDRNIRLQHWEEGRFV